MNGAHIHLILNHIPVLGVPLCLLLLAIARFQKNQALARLAYQFSIGAALLAIPVYLTGEPAEDIAKSLPQVTESFIEAHEEAAQMALILTLVAGALSVCQFLKIGALKPAQRWIRMLAVVVLIGSAGALAYAANLGGQIRHTELRVP